MADEPQAAPSAPPMVAPAAPTEPKPRRVRKRSAVNKGGRPRLTDDEKKQRREAAEQAEREQGRRRQEQLNARRSVQRLAAIGALTPHLLNFDEIAGLSKFVLAMLQSAPEQEPETQP